ncbi:hypothetical protein GGR21_000591 [Dysgonomonas hofstadii]|uniref:DUF4405 domain-containing protein n=1 Tax=Dysgonomonas hofstadii TaxID=637886 RepID=A0A840CMG4_9BACT|nr:DUF4405 domain-containing protein [Dysgonomonas hofstadii]MBB4034704.1 hypothetical protein [Dysgonomonas hofstadii]
MKRKISLIKGKPIFIVDLILIPVFALVIYSGLKLHVAGHISGHDTWTHWTHFHVITAILSLLFGGLHVKAHWGWYKSLIKNGIGKKSKITTILSVLFLIEIITGVILVFFIEGGNSSAGIWHYRLGLVMIVFVLIHIITRFSLMMKGLGWNRKKK